MSQPLSHLLPATRREGLAGWLADQLRYLRFAALLVVFGLSPRVHDRATRRDTARILCAVAWQPMTGYLLGATLISAVLTRIVTVSAASYGLSHLALEAILRVFIIEVLPLAAALVVAARAVPLAMQRLSSQPGNRRATARDILPFAIGNTVAVAILAVISGLVALVVAYLVVHGFSQWALAGYARLIGQVFDPLLAIAFSAKIALFGMAVGVAPTTVVLDSRKGGAGLREMRVMVRLLLILVLIEGSFLILRGF